MQQVCIALCHSVLIGKNIAKLQAWKNIWSKNEKSSKIEKDQKKRYIILCAFWLLLQKLNIWKRHWVQGYVSTQIWDLSNIYYFPRVRSPKLFSNSWGNLYNTFVVLQSWTKYLRQTLVFMWNRTLLEKFNFNFSGVFCQKLKKKKKKMGGRQH